MLGCPGSNSETLTMRESDLLKILDVLYDTALERDSWTSVLQALAGPVDGVTGHLLNWDKQCRMSAQSIRMGVCIGTES